MKSNLHPSFCITVLNITFPGCKAVLIGGQFVAARRFSLKCCCVGNLFDPCTLQSELIYSNVHSYPGDLSTEAQFNVLGRL